MVQIVIPVQKRPRDTTNWANEWAFIIEAWYSQSYATVDELLVTAAPATQQTTAGAL